MAKNFMIIVDCVLDYLSDIGEWSEDGIDGFVEDLRQELQDTLEDELQELEEAEEESEEDE